MPSTLPVPAGFWAQIDHQLDRLVSEKADTFDAVREILLDPSYADIGIERNRNGEAIFGPNSAFFAGSGGDRTVHDSLTLAGWHTVAFDASYYYALKNLATGDTLTYIEGDLLRGDSLTRKN